MKALINILFISLISTQLYAQQITVSGTVHDESGLPLPGVNVIEKGTTNGTQSDFDGNYSITANEAAILTFTYIGFKAQEIKINKTHLINVIMKADVAMLDEVVVTAQGIKRESKSIGYAVSTITQNRTPSKAQLKRQKQKAYHNKIAKQLSGKITGVNVTPGASNKIVIRGNSVNQKKQPLYIVDGIPIHQQYNNLVQNLDEKEITHVNVYKAAKAREIFGKVAKNGCIVITTSQGNYRIENDESYAQINENQFETTKLSPLSTFSIDVDKASYSNIRRMINNGQKIPFGAVKIEEMINYFNYNYPQPVGEHPFSINTELAETPWNKDTKLVKIGLQGKRYEKRELPASNLTFLIDVSGSMSSSNKLPLLKSAFKLLVNQLREKDKVAIVVYAGAAGVVLKPTSGEDKKTILSALDNLNAGGSTAGGEGIKLAYKLAEKHFNKKGNNRVILATDGDFNVGASSDSDMEKLIQEKRKSGVFLSVLGFGYGNYKDSKLEILADKGNGNHAYIDTMQEAQKVFGNEFGGTLHTIAKDVKIQIEFNPNKVQAYRLIGYENRLLADEDFIDDTKDAGELGSGHTVTALYEVIPIGVKSELIKEVHDLKYTDAKISDNFSNELFTVKFRYKKPNGNKSIEMIHVQNDTSNKLSDNLKFAASVALFGMQLRNSKFYNNTSSYDVIALADAARGKDKDGFRAEFVRLVKAYQLESQVVD